MFTADKQEQPRALCMEGECLQEKQVQPHAFVMEGECLHKNSHKVSGYLQVVAVIRQLNKTQS